MASFLLRYSHQFFDGVLQWNAAIMFAQGYGVQVSDTCLLERSSGSDAIKCCGLFQKLCAATVKDDL